MSESGLIAKKYKYHRSLIEHFFTSSNNKNLQKYKSVLEGIASGQLKVLVIYLADIRDFDEDLYENLRKNAETYFYLFLGVIDRLLSQKIKRYPKSKLDIFIETQIMLGRKLEADIENNECVKNVIPSDLSRKYELYFTDETSNTENKSIRNLTANRLGHLVTFKGIVTKASNICPLMQVATYTCSYCCEEVFQKVKGQTYKPLTVCPSETCVTQKSETLILQTKYSKFCNYQEIIVQEDFTNLEKGALPRLVKVIVTGEQVSKVDVSDNVEITGIYLPLLTKKSSLEKLETYIDAHSIQKIDNYQLSNEDNAEISAEELKNIEDSICPYERLAFSLAPTIIGYKDLKKMMLIFLVCGLQNDEYPFRSNLNLAIFGDPGTAKSQFLTYINQFAPKSVYINGTGASQAGMSAFVSKDSTNGEATLNGGALVLADGGICCIDEFDKMNENSKEIVHEAMESHFISINKAGIQTKLNTRISVLVAANPAFSIYNSAKTVDENINLPTSFLTRFDIIWLLKDKPRKNEDRHLAHKICEIHKSKSEFVYEQKRVKIEREKQRKMRNMLKEKMQAEGQRLNLFYLREAAIMKEEEEEDIKSEKEYENLLYSALLDEPKIPEKTLQKYLEFCRNRKTHFPKELTRYLVENYVEIRKKSRDTRNSKETTYTSPRTVNTLMRMSIALSKLANRSEVQKDDISEAVRLIEASKISLQEYMFKDFRIVNDVEKILYLIKNMATFSQKLEIQQIIER